MCSKFNFEEEQMLFNKTAQNIVSQTAITSSSTMAEQPCETWKLCNMGNCNSRNFNALGLDGDKIH